MTQHRSLFERLECPVPSEACSLSSVAAHLQKMLSTRVGSVQILPDYGLPDLNDMRVSLHESLSQVRLHIERFIQAYEPRLTDVQVKMLPRDRDPLALAFAIQGSLVVAGVCRPVVFRARMADAGQVEVAPDVL